MKPVASLQKEIISKIVMNVLPTGLPLCYIFVICGDSATHATFELCKCSEEFPIVSQSIQQHFLCCG